MLAQVVAEQLGADVANVTVTTGDTAAIALGLGGSNSRQTVTAGSSAHVAAVKVREKTLAIAAQLLEAAAGDLEIVGDHVRVKGVPDMKVGLARIARAVAGTAGFSLPQGVAPGLEATEHVVIDDMAHANGTAVVEVEVDVETGRVDVLRYVSVHDCGRMVHPTLVDGQIAGGTAHGIGNALYEWMGYDADAQPVTTTFADYLLVTATEMPRLEIAHQESPSPLNPLGVKGVGECGVVPVTAAIASAVEDALAPFGVRITQTPMLPAHIVAMIEEAKTGDRPRFPANKAKVE
jgi:carbon-monoxide dehydrogenase large subunit